MAGLIMDKGLGNPSITTRLDAREELPSSGEYFINNRVIAFHFGYEGSVRSMNYIFKASWSKNYGTYWTTDEEQSTGIIRSRFLWHFW